LRDLRHRSLMCSAVIQPSRNTTPTATHPWMRNVSARQCRSRDVLDIRLEPKLVELLPPGELMPPRVAAHLATVAFPVSEHLESSQPPRNAFQDRNERCGGCGPASEATACFCAGLSARMTASNRSAAGKRDFCACSIERYSAATTICVGAPRAASPPAASSAQSRLLTSTLLAGSSSSTPVRVDHTNANDS